MKMTGQTQKELAIIRREKSLQLRVAGMSYYYISQELGCSKSTAHEDVQKAIREIQESYAETAKQVRTIEANRLERLILAIWKDAVKGDKLAIDRLVKLMERKAKLLGLDAPKRVEMETNVIDVTIKRPDGETS